MFLIKNVLEPSEPGGLKGQDLIFLRNVSIYFDPPTRRRALERLKGLLVPGGYLLVGSTETLANDLGVLRLCEREGVFLFVNQPPDSQGQGEGSGIRFPPEGQGPDQGVPLEDAGSRRQVNPTLVTPPLDPCQSGLPGSVQTAEDHGSNRRVPTWQHPAIHPPSVERGNKEGISEPTLRDAARIRQQALALAQAERYAETLEEIEPLCVAPDLHPEDLVFKGGLLFTQGRLAEAERLAKQLLAADPWELGALLLLNRICQVQGRIEEAIVWLRRAIYHRPDTWTAHFQLAEVYRAAGQVEQARREYRVVLGQLERPALQLSAGLELIGLPALPLGDVRELCRSCLERLKDPEV
ncbi:CheR family methyltransferase [Caldichromatium japonicum]|uniref:CheR family methyltransferase n=1 Tax=Caldichromatium japonicum TaxID=2699430 RepID=UPI001FE83E45|nr:CheR family methyltransferase [Caldichromatium japonicum]